MGCPKVNSNYWPLVTPRVTPHDPLKAACLLAAIFSANEQGCNRITLTTQQLDLLHVPPFWSASIL